MTYNIYNGAENTFADVLNIVRAAQPDLLVLNEANGFDRNGKLAALANTGLAHYHLEPCGDGDTFHVALLSRRPFAERIRAIHPLARAAILAVLELPELGDTAVVGTHLTPHSETRRKEEVQAILRALTPYNEAAVAGDFNALSPHDQYPNDLETRLTPDQVKKFSTNGNLSFAAIQAMLDAGFVDVAVEVAQQNTPTVPTAANTDPDHAGTKLRLDYVFALGRLAGRITGYGVLVNAATDQASDHYPIIADFAGEL